MVLLGAADGAPSGGGATTAPVTTAPGWLTAVPGCTVGGTWGGAVEARLPLSQVREIAAHAGVAYVGLVPHPLSLAESEGLAGMRVPAFWSRYRQGDGVRVGVLDIGFAGYSRLLGSELPANVQVRAFYDTGTGPDITAGGQDHGTACAEVVHDVAPGAELYLANAGTPGEMQSAVTWLIEQGVEVISHSIAWPLGGGDGTGPIQDIVQLARDNGVLWVNAAGNFAESHWGGPWRDDDGDRILEVDDLESEAILLPASGGGHAASAWLTWDRWPTSTDLELEIELVAADGRLLASSQYDYADYPYAFRPIDVSGSTDLSGAHFRVRCVRGDPEGRFIHVTRLDGDLAPASRVPAGSLAIPADSPDVVAVGAYAWSDRSLEPYSSYGPTLDGRAKPDILGPDHMQNTVRDPFLGTSAACPHVAGAIALLLGAGPRGGLFDARPNREQVLAFLRHEAGPLDRPSPAGSAGWGCVRLPEDRMTGRAPRLQVLGNGAGIPTLRLEQAPAGARSCDIFDLEGRLVARLDGASKGNGLVDFPATPLASLALARGRYWAREPATGARASFLWPGAARR
jgi:subtilisin family serine protease